MKKLYLTLLFALICSLFTWCRAQYSVVLNFNGINGANPMGSLIACGNNLYGMTSLGGYYNKGCIFTFNFTNQVYTDLLDFNGSNGANPQGSLLIAGKRLYGMTMKGGRNGKGVIFAMDTDGGGYFDIADLNAASGYNPYGSLLLINGKLYGMTDSGGSNNGSDYGLIFSIDTNGSRWKDIEPFITSNGEGPHGTLLQSVSGDTLFGMASNGGNNQNGVIFSLDTAGNNFTDIYDFNQNDNGAEPYGSLVLNGNELYGMTQFGSGGTDGLCVFKLKTDSSTLADSNSFVQIFNSSSNLDVLKPCGDLTFSGNNIYGMTAYGGINNDGMIFSIIDSGVTCTVPLSNLSNIFSLTDSLGKNPFGSLLNLNGVLYGMTSAGGNYNDGVIFKIDTSFVSSVKQIRPNQGIVTIYPNPGQGLFTLTWMNSQPGIKKMEIYNELGILVHSQLSETSNRCSVDLSSQPGGVYLFRVLNVNLQLIGEGKFIIQK
jgi:uncharacterized repeat protein (TIGR03803 family)